MPIGVSTDSGAHQLSPVEKIEINGKNASQYHFDRSVRVNNNLQAISGGENDILLSVGHIESGMAVLVTPEMQLVEIPISVLSPSTSAIKQGNIFRISSYRQKNEEIHVQEQFEAVQAQILRDLGRRIDGSRISSFGTLKLIGKSHTSLFFQWPSWKDLCAICQIENSIDGHESISDNQLQPPFNTEFVHFDEKDVKEISPPLSTIGNYQSPDDNDYKYGSNFGLEPSTSGHQKLPFDQFSTQLSNFVNEGNSRSRPPDQQNYSVDNLRGESSLISEMNTISTATSNIELSTRDLDTVPHTYTPRMESKSQSFNYFSGKCDSGCKIQMNSAIENQANDFRDDNPPVKVHSIEAYCNGQRLPTATIDPDETTLHLTGLDPGSTYTVRIVFRTAAGIFSTNEATGKTPTLDDMSCLCVTVLPGAEGESSSNTIIEALQEMGARVSFEFNPDETTHVVLFSAGDVPNGESSDASDTVSPILKKCRENNVPVVDSGWVFACKRAGRMQSVSHFYPPADKR